MPVEIQFKVRDSAGSFDGMPVVAKSVGARFTPAELAAWLNAGTEPPGMATLPPVAQRQTRRILRYLRYALSPTFNEEAAAAESGLPIDEVRRLKENAEAARGDLTLHGYDTNWSWNELRRFGHLVVEDLTLDQVREFMEQPLETSAHDLAWDTYRVRKRDIRVPYWNLAPPAYVARLRDEADLVHVPRGQVRTLAEVREAL